MLSDIDRVLAAHDVGGYRRRANGFGHRQATAALPQPSPAIEIRFEPPQIVAGPAVLEPFDGG
jgi:hypothetical protein